MLHFSQFPCIIYLEFYCNEGGCTHDSTETNEYMLRLKELMKNQYTFKANEHDDPNIKRGLRNADGTGVLLGITNIGSVQGYTIQDGERMPAPGQLYYRGISVEDIVGIPSQEQDLRLHRGGVPAAGGQAPHPAAAG